MQKVVLQRCRKTLWTSVFQADAVINTSVVHQAVNVAKFTPDLFCCNVSVFMIGQLHDHCFSCETLLTQIELQITDCFLVAIKDDCNGTFLRAEADYGRANSLSASREQNHLALQIQIH